MASTVFVDGETLIEASWLNDVNEVVYNPAVVPADVLYRVNNLSDVADPLTARTNIGAASELQCAYEVSAGNRIPRTAPAHSDFNAFLNSGVYNFDAALSPNKPVGITSWVFLEVFRHVYFSSGNEYVVQYAHDMNGWNPGRIYTRRNALNAWTEWTQVGEVELATQAEAEAGTDDTVVMTPLKTAQAIPAKLNASGSAPVYACRAWVNFNGTGTVAIRASGNVSSITDNGTGDYTVNFATAMPDANYAVTFGGSGNSASPAASGFTCGLRQDVPPTAAAFRIITGSVGTSSGIATDQLLINATIFR